MSHNKIEGAPTILRSAPRGSKKGWVPVTTELPPDEHEAFLRICARRRVARTDLAREAIEKLIESDERRSGTERRKAVNQ